MSVESLSGWSAASSIGIGVCCGVAEFVWHTAAQKVAMVAAQFEAKPSWEPDEVPASLPFEALDKNFSVIVIKAPLYEELICRGIIQPAIAYGAAWCFPQLAASAIWGLSSASLLSVATTAMGFGLVHYPNYEKGGMFPATLATISGLVFGGVREKFGLAASIAAHMTTNLGTGLLDKYWPQVLEFSHERELRLLPPKERELRLLKEALARASEEITQMQGSDKAELEAFRSSWQDRIEQLDRKVD